MPAPTDETATASARSAPATAPAPAPAPAIRTGARTEDVNRLGDELVGRLRDALGRHGITLPSLYPDYPMGDKPLIMLGRVNQETAERLTALLDSIDGPAD